MKFTFLTNLLNTAQTPRSINKHVRAANWSPAKLTPGVKSHSFSACLVFLTDWRLAYTGKAGRRGSTKFLFKINQKYINTLTILRSMSVFPNLFSHAYHFEVLCCAAYHLLYISYARRRRSKISPPVTRRTI